MPGYIPVFKIVKGGNDITRNFADRTISITVELSAGGSAGDSCEIALDDRDFRISSPQVGDRIDVYLGYENVGLEFMGSFEVNSVRYLYPPKSIIVRGTTASGINDLKSQKIEDFADKTIEQILAEAGQKVGLKVQVHKDIADNKIPFLNGTNSFGHLISRLESHYDAVAKIMDGKITLTPRSGGRTVSDFAMPTFVFRDYSFADYQVDVDSRGDYGKVSAQFRDKTTNKTETTEAKTQNDNKSESEHLIGRIFNSKEEAESAAESVMAQLDRSGEKISATLSEGDPWVRDGQRIVVAGIRSGVDGSYILDIVRHVYTKASGIRTSFTGTGGVNGLAAEYASGTAAQGAFLAPDAGQFFGHLIAPRDGTLLDQQFGSLPSFTSAPTTP